MGRRIQLRRADRPTDPEARDRGIAPGILRIVGERAARPCGREVSRHLGIVGGDVGIASDVGLGRVGQVAERHRPADDRHRIAGRQPRLAVPPPAPGRAREAGIGGLGRMDGQQRLDGRRSIRFGDGEHAARPQPDAGREVVAGSLLVERRRHVPARVAREDPDDAALVADLETDRALFVEVGVEVADVVGIADRRVVVDARLRLERRDEDDLGRLDVARDPDLPGGHRGDRRARGVADASGPPVAAHAAYEQPQAGPDTGHGSDGDRREHRRVHRGHGSGRPDAPRHPCASVAALGPSDGPQPRGVRCASARGRRLHRTATPPRPRSWRWSIPCSRPWEPSPIRSAGSCGATTRGPGGACWRRHWRG